MTKVYDVRKAIIDMDGYPELVQKYFISEIQIIGCLRHDAKRLIGVRYTEEEKSEGTKGRKKDKMFN